MATRKAVLTAEAIRESGQPNFNPLHWLRGQGFDLDRDIAIVHKGDQLEYTQETDEADGPAWMPGPGTRAEGAEREAPQLRKSDADPFADTHTRDQVVDMLNRLPRLSGAHMRLLAQVALHMERQQGESDEIVGVQAYKKSGGFMDFGASFPTLSPAHFERLHAIAHEMFQAEHEGRLWSPSTLRGEEPAFDLTLKAPEPLDDLKGRMMEAAIDRYQTPEEVRAQALELAVDVVRSQGSRANPAQIVPLATGFESYLSGKPITARRAA